MIVFVILTVEGLAGLSLYVAEQRFPGQVLELFIANHFASIPQGHIQDYREHSYDARLGRDYRTRSLCKSGASASAMSRASPLTARAGTVRHRGRPR
jgi:hypothetical protein